MAAHRHWDRTRIGPARASFVQAWVSENLAAIVLDRCCRYPFYPNAANEYYPPDGPCILSYPDLPASTCHLAIGLVSMSLDHSRAAEVEACRADRWLHIAGQTDRSQLRPRLPWSTRHRRDARRHAGLVGIVLPQSCLQLSQNLFVARLAKGLCEQSAMRAVASFI